MTAEDAYERLSLEEVFMIALLGIVIAVMLFALNRDLEPSAGQSLPPISRPDDIGKALSEADPVQAAPNVIPPPAYTPSDVRPAGEDVASLQPQSQEKADAADARRENASLQSVLVPIDFSLAELEVRQAVPQADQGAIKVRKSLRVDERLVGNIEVNIPANGEPYLDIKDLRNILRRSGNDKVILPSRLPPTGLLTFSDLREAGIDLRYLPTEDVVVINP
ncbi:MAG: hypothetical protein V2I74_11250 [Erythrobacter sp.]|jgi:hypothetical protein|nr:hypothetical protein [Erythrobacter sp.]